MKIGIVSDTHGFLPNSIHEAFAGVDRIVHAGDVGSFTQIAELRAIAPVCGAMGNNDFEDYLGTLSPRLACEFDGVTFLVAHRQRDTGWPGGTAQIVVCGHTHVPMFVENDGRYLINPGSATYPRQGSVKSAAIVTVRAGKVLGFDFCEL